MTTDKRAAAIAALIVRDVAEIPDRCSPDDQPEMMLVTSGELTDIVMRRLAALEADDGRALLRNRLADWCVQHGAALCPGARADTFGEGMREAKRQVRGILDSVAPEQPAPEPANGMHPVLYWLGGGKFARAMKVGDSPDGALLVVDLSTGDGPSVVGKPDWFDEGYVAAYGGLVPECATEGHGAGEWSYGVAQLSQFVAAAADTELEDALDDLVDRCLGGESPSSRSEARKRVEDLFRRVRDSRLDCMTKFELTRAAPPVGPSSIGQDTGLPRLATAGTGEAGSTPAGPLTSSEPAAPHADDEARIAEAEESMTLVVDTRPSAETLRTLVRSAVTMMRSLAAGKAKAEAELAAVDAAIADRGVPERDCSLPLPERVSNIISELKNWRHEAGTAQAEVERLTGIIDDTTNTEATNADTVADLRAKLAEAEKKKDAFFHSLSRAMETLDHIRDNHVQGDDVSDHEGIAQAVDRIAAERDAAVAKLADAEKRLQSAEQRAENLIANAELMAVKATLRAEKAEGEAKVLRAERDAVRTDLANINSALAEAEPMRQHGSAVERIRDLNGARQTAVTIAAQYAIERDAALAAQNARAVEELDLVVDGCKRAAASWRNSAMCAMDQHERDRLESRVVQLEGVAHHTKLRADELRAAKPEPVPESHHTANVCGIRRKSDGYWWQCDSEHGAGWNDKRIRQAWTMRAAHAHIADMRAKGMLREEVEVVELAPAEPVPAAADAKPGDARRSLVQEDHNVWTPELSMAIIDAIDGLDERLRALEVRR